MSPTKRNSVEKEAKCLLRELLPLGRRRKDEAAALESLRVQREPRPIPDRESSRSSRARSRRRRDCPSTDPPRTPAARARAARRTTCACRSASCTRRSAATRRLPHTSYRLQRSTTPPGSESSSSPERERRVLPAVDERQLDEGGRLRLRRHDAHTLLPAREGRARNPFPPAERQRREPARLTLLEHPPPLGDTPLHTTVGQNPHRRLLAGWRQVYNALGGGGRTPIIGRLQPNEAVDSHVLLCDGLATTARSPSDASATRAEYYWDFVTFIGTRWRVQSRRPFRLRDRAVLPLQYASVDTQKRP